MAPGNSRIGYLLVPLCPWRPLWSNRVIASHRCLSSFPFPEDGRPGSTRGAYPTAFAGERDEKRVLASITIHPCGTVSEDAASAFGKPTADKV